MTRHAWAVLLLLLTGGLASGADLTKIDRRIKKEPAYQTKSPGYAMLVIGPEARDRVWLVVDGTTLYVDRDGDGDLTGADEKVSPKKGGSAEEGYDFDVGELALGGKKHYRLTVGVAPLKRYLFDDFAKRADLIAAAKNPDAKVLRIGVEVEAPHLKPKGRVFMLVGPIDLTGALMPADNPADAPVVHLGGPLQISIYGSRPTLRRNRSTEVYLVAGTPGVGGGTFAMLGYDETIPKGVRPIAEFEFPAAKGGEPIKKRFEFKERC